MENSKWKYIAGFVLPGVVLAFLPKCPVCVAAYLAVAGVSIGVAGWMRTAAVVLCLAAMIFAVARLAFIFRTKQQQLTH